MGSKNCTCYIHTDCFANKNKHCMALSDTKFTGKDCPFYKTHEQAKEGRRNAYNRLVITGRDDLIDKYGGHSADEY